MKRVLRRLWAWSAVALAAAARAQSAVPAEPVAPAEAPPSALADRLGWNSRERTATGIRALEKGDAAAGKEALDTALRLRPADPTARYNAGTGRLAAGDPTAGDLLDQAAREATPELAPSAWYNLGEAKFGAQEFRGAAEAFVETLKRRPDHADAKHNLELALRELDKQQKQQQQQQQQNNGKSEPQEQGGDQKQPQDQPPKDDPNQGGDDPNGQPRPSEPDPSRPPQPKPPGSLPKFQDQPDMTAEQAAALLRAVENLERQQRQDRAEKAAKAARMAVEIDW